MYISSICDFVLNSEQYEDYIDLITMYFFCGQTFISS